jgi:hypothetical protein
VIVSAYFKIPSKQPHEFYMKHMHRWFRAVSAPVIFFTSADVKAELDGYGYGAKPNVRIVAMDFADLTAWSRWGRAFWERQKERDSEKYHTPELAAIWYEKKEFVRRAMELDTAASVFVWCDAGCVRDQASETAMRLFGTRTQGISLDDGRLHLQHIRNQAKKEFYRFPEYRYAGAIIAGNRIAWARHYDVFDRVVRDYDDAGISANSDQYVMQRCADLVPEIYSEHFPPKEKTVDVWFFFLGLI